jgi:hypothetical protein
MPDDELGLKHRHEHDSVTTIADLRRAQRALHWDTDASRILRIDVCDVCGEYDRMSVSECAQADCREHRICEARFR